MKVRVTFDLTQFQRRAIAHHQGAAGAASHPECRAALESFAQLELETISHEYLGHLAGKALDAMVHSEETP